MINTYNTLVSPGASAAQEGVRILAAIAELELRCNQVLSLAGSMASRNSMDLEQLSAIKGSAVLGA